MWQQNEIEMANFTKQNFNEKAINENDYIKMFNKLGFDVEKVVISYTNGCSAYITLNVIVLDERKMWAETSVFEGKSTITVRVSDHWSNLERICGGVSGNKMSMQAFQKLIENNVIANK